MKEKTKDKIWAAGFTLWIIYITVITALVANMLLGACR